MKRDYKYTVALLTVLLATLFVFYLLFKKYSYETLSHFVQSCQRLFSIIWPPNIHTIGFILLGLIATLSLIFVLKIIFSYASFHLKLKKYQDLHTDFLPKKLKNIIAKNKILSPIALIESDLPIAMCYGFLKPSIFLSTSLVNRLPKYQLESVLLHELYHVNHKHMLLIFTNEIIKSLLFFFPVLKDLIRRITKSFENGADLFVINSQKTDKYLNEARKLFVSSDNNAGLVLIPSFSSGVNYKHNESQLSNRYLLVSLSFGVLLLLLLFMPTRVLADNHAVSEVITTCSNYQCSTHCISKLTHRIEPFSVNLNYTPVSE
ncbi:hypothetical protein C4561_05645 [candidate division WWE3 bacterium]|jgi:hypothetical protein|uniref:Peptidase M56 domain-containing protein n=1 Tax=candidate division WWE3 bacterium TaxID=2053526 RepID=A0A3A4ZHY1_UNCKA|nr:MAG: hypothetical protein C4561_05645 [candidate division WWE3 bacterium]